MKVVSLASKYTLFALIATAVNLLVQWPFFIWSDSWLTLYIALFFGTLAGLVAKYILDKRWIFYHQSETHRDNLAKFGLYSLMGVFTTLIFWGFEMGFYYWVEYPNAQYLGGALGLAIGYVAKYLLDRRFVFKAEG
ncbi:GtrA family protein [Thiomicrorhabdus sp.]|uniref:GtrA family protein n=1 Tax=Thiomicrorhabdus sp. TaxID=2039724 RepID=UPI0029C78E7A|nr:GtrA family protein [Thiomicrorhabdus sp.]